jgi:hypothetical protein
MSVVEPGRPPGSGQATARSGATLADSPMSGRLGGADLSAASPSVLADSPMSGRLGGADVSARRFQLSPGSNVCTALCISGKTPCAAGCCACDNRPDNSWMWYVGGAVFFVFLIFILLMFTR